VEPRFDPLSPEFLADPFAVMASLGVADRPVFYAPAIDDYVVTRYRDIESIFSDPGSYSAAAAQLPLVELDPQARQVLLDGGHRPQPSMVSLDPPAHTRLRRPTARAFSARRTAEMEPRIRLILEQILAEVDLTAPFDLVSALTFPLPATVVFSFIGVPEEDYAQLKAWCGSRATLAWGRPAAEEQLEHAAARLAQRRAAARIRAGAGRQALAVMAASSFRGGEAGTWPRSWPHGLGRGGSRTTICMTWRPRSRPRTGSISLTVRQSPARGC
jgi:cytochrome P450